MIHTNLAKRQLSSRSLGREYSNNSRHSFRLLEKAKRSSEIGLAPLLFNICMYERASTICRNFAYANDLALLLFFLKCKDLEGTLRQDMITLSVYL